MNTKTLLGASFAVLFAFAMVSNPVFAAGDPKEMTAASVSAGTITITTAGQSGDVVPDSDKIFGYVVFTDADAFIVASHIGIDDDDATGDNDWHSHTFTLDSNGCVDSLTSTGEATLDGNTITIDDSGATSVSQGFFVMLKINPDDSICVHKTFKPITFS